MNIKPIIMNTLKWFFALGAISLLLITYTSCIEMVSVSSSNSKEGKPIISIHNSRTNEQIIKSLAETTATCPNINAQIGDTLSVHINIEDLDIKNEEEIISYMQVFFLSNEIDIKDIPASFNFIIPEVPSGTYPITLNGSYSIKFHKKTSYGEAESWETHRYSEETIARVVI